MGVEPTIWIYALGSVALISTVSLAGALTLVRDTSWLERRVGDLVSMAAGVLLGGAVIHLLPHGFERLGGGLELPLYFLLGFVGFFFLERYLWAHHHGVDGGHDHSLHAHGHHLRAHTDSDAEEGEEPGHVHPVIVLNLLGDGIHNFIDGMLIAAAYIVDPGLGVVTAVAVLLHEVPQEIGDFAILVQGGLRPRKALLFNFISATMALAGAALALTIGARSVGFADVLIPVAAGNFLYIAAADLIPELHRSHRDGGFRHLVIFLAALGVMIALRVVLGSAGHAH